LSTTIAFWIRKLSVPIFLIGYLGTANQVQAQVAEIVQNPSVNEDRVTLRIKVTGSDSKPLMGLDETDFRLNVDNQLLEFDPADWRSPQETEPPPAWILVLLDMSGSMSKLDIRGTTKLEGAIQAIREFLNGLADRGPNTMVSIVPFGKPGQGCEGYSVDENSLNKFFAANEFKLQNYLNNLSKLTPCASTNLYEPLGRAIRFLGNQNDSRFIIPEDSSQPTPRLSVVLLSDGYHTEPNESQDFEDLTSLIRRNPQIIVHTLGYGLTPEQLGEKYRLGRAATRADISSGTGKVPEEEFVDRERLTEVAQRTGGIAEFSGDALAIADKLKLFLDALLGEYEITYTEPNADRGSRHTVNVAVNVADGTTVESESKSYRIEVFGRSLPTSTRFSMVLLVLLALGIGGVLPFWFWAQSLKRELQDL